MLGALNAGSLPTANVVDLSEKRRTLATVLPQSRTEKTVWHTGKNCLVHRMGIRLRRLGAPEAGCQYVCTALTALIGPPFLE
jgi:hypothetical protein